MGKMKDLYINQYQVDLEREHYINDTIARQWQEEEYEKLKQDPEMNYPHTTKISISDGTTRIQIGEKKSSNNPITEIFGNGL